MTSIKLYVNGAHARAQVFGELVAGTVGIMIDAKFNDEWNDLAKHLVCRNGKIVKTKLDFQNGFTVAPEAMIAGGNLEIGFEGMSQDGNIVFPTVWASCGVVKDGANANDDYSADPTNPVWDQLEKQIGDLNELETDAKSSIVDAVNEVAKRDVKINVATANSLGGVKAELVTENDTQPVRIGEDGMLYTAPGGIPGAGNARETTVLAELALTEDVDGTIRIPLIANPFAYSALLIEIRSQRMTDGRTQYTGQLYGGGKHSQIFHLNTVFDASSVKTVYVMTHLFHDAVHSIAAKKGDYMWNTTNHYTDVYPIETPADANECVLEIENCSAVSGATFKVQGVK